MKRLPVVVLVVVALLGIARVGAITYGWVDQEGHPNVGTMFYSVEGSVYRACSGTLISSNVFLTASHCTALLDSLPQGALDWVGVSFKTDPPHRAAVIRGTHHTNPEYYTQMGIDAADVAVVVLDEAPSELEPARLPTAGMFDAWYGRERRFVKDLRFTAVGYGSLGPTFGGGPPVFQPSGSYRYFAYSKFAAIDKVYLHLLANQATGDGGICRGDSGGPAFVWQDGEETNLIAGVAVSVNAMCVATNFIYRLDTPTARRFLGQFVSLP